MKIEVTFGWVLAILLQSLDGEEWAGTGSQNRTANYPLSKHKLCSMWDSILNYSVYTVSGRGNGQSITDGGQSASTQQVKEASKVKQSSKGHVGGRLLKRLFVPWRGYKLLNHFFSWASEVCHQNTETYRRDQWSPILPKFESLLKVVKDGSTSQLRKCRCLSFVIMVSRISLCQFVKTKLPKKKKKLMIWNNAQHGSVRLSFMSER